MKSISSYSAAAAAAANEDEKEKARKALEEALAKSATKVAEIDLPDAEYERKSYEAPSDEKIKEDAKNSLESYKNETLSAIEEKVKADAKAKESAISSVNDNLSKTEKSVASNYAAATQNFENDALKRGLARSSIAVNNSKAIQSEAAAALSAAREEASSKIVSLESEIADLEASRQTAINNFNIAYAVKLTEKINDLSSERDKKAAEVLEYNNSISEKELKSQYDKAKIESDLYSEALKQAATEDSMRYTDTFVQYKYKQVEEYLSKLSPEDAKEAIKNDPLLRDNLSDYYYYTLYNKYGF